MANTKRIYRILVTGYVDIQAESLEAAKDVSSFIEWIPGKRWFVCLDRRAGYTEDMGPVTD